MHRATHVAGTFTTLESLFLLATLPLVGVALTGQSPRLHLEFPPRTIHVQHAGFSWTAFAIVALLIGLMVGPLALKLWRGRRATTRRGTPSESSVAAAPASAACRFPWWGWIGLVFGVGAWILAWARFPWFAPWQPFTFSPLWLAYILVVNALTFRRSKRCMMLNRTGHFLAMFPVSAAFWWFFEYLNRFVQNWHYVGIAGLTAREYFLFASLPFATVLPAVLGTRELLETYPALTAGLDSFPPRRLRHSKALAATVLSLACASLAGLAIWPDLLFPMVWLAPLPLILCPRVLRGEPVFAGLGGAGWSNVARLALAALICGFFWEMWNYGSLAKWIYLVPYVDRFRLFEMPLLGYAGYLPFGLECAAVARMFLGYDASEGSATTHEEGVR
jgi:hypothetical protein